MYAGNMNVITASGGLHRAPYLMNTTILVRRGTNSKTVVGCRYIFFLFSFVFVAPIIVKAWHIFVRPWYTNRAQGYRIAVAKLNLRVKCVFDDNNVIIIIFTTFPEIFWVSDVYPRLDYSNKY